MIDPITLVAVITACSALIVSVLTHIKHSQCFGIDITTTESNTPTTTTPIMPKVFTT